MIDPTRLIDGTKAVYGEVKFDELYGEIPPIDAERVVVAEDDDVLELGHRALRFFHTPGHAKHHMSIFDESSRGVFTGDAFGVSYREFDTEHGEFIFPTTTPIQFEPDAMHASIERILSFDPKCCYLTHYSQVMDPERLAADLHRCVDAFVAIAREHEKAAERTELMERDMFDFLSESLDRHGVDPDPGRRHALLDMDVKLNVQGVEGWLDRVTSQS